MPNTIPPSAALSAAARSRDGWLPAVDRAGSMRYPRVGLGALSSRALLLTLLGALCLLLAGLPARAAELRLRVDGDRGGGIELALYGASGGPVAAHARADLAPIEGTLIVRNPIDRTVFLLVDGQRRLIVIPNGTRSLRLGLGEHTLALALDGRVIASERLAVGAASARLWAPRVAMIGTLVVHSDWPRGLVRVYLDGRPRFDLAPEQTRRFKLSPGSHELLVRSSTHQVLEHRTVLVDRYRVTEVDVDRDDADRDDEHQRLPQYCALR